VAGAGSRRRIPGRCRAQITGRLVAGDRVELVQRVGDGLADRLGRGDLFFAAGQDREAGRGVVLGGRGVERIALGRLFGGIALVTQLVRLGPNDITVAAVALAVELLCATVPAGVGECILGHDDLLCRLSGSGVFRATRGPFCLPPPIAYVSSI
jgi:hypothetical protein